MPRVTPKLSDSLPLDFDALIRMHPPRAIRDEVDYDNVQEIIDALTWVEKLSKGQAEYLETLTILFSDYERKAHAIDTSDFTPLDMLKHLLDEHGLNGSDLGRLLGERSLGPKILGGSREISKANARKLGEYFGVSVALFI